MNVNTAKNIEILNYKTGPSLLSMEFTIIQQRHLRETQPKESLSTVRFLFLFVFDLVFFLKYDFKILRARLQVALVK